MTRFEGIARQARVLARLHGCLCTPAVTWGLIDVDGRVGPVIRLGHQLDCPHLEQLRGLADAERLPCDLVTAKLWLAGGDDAG